RRGACCRRDRRRRVVARIVSRGKAMRIAKNARSAETKVSRAIDTMVERLIGSSPLQPLELLHAVLDEVEHQVQPASRGAWTFPFNRVVVDLLAPTRDDKARLGAVVGDAESLRARIAERLKPTCEIGPLDVRIRFRARGDEKW